MSDFVQPGGGHGAGRIDLQRGVQTRAFICALEEERGHLIVALYDLDPKNVEALMDAAQLIDKECQDILEAHERDARDV